MKDYIFNLLENFSLDTIIISLIIFALTMILKYPIKKLTSKLNEEKRKAVNTIIIFIPILLSIIISYTYLNITKNIDTLSSYLNLITNSFILSLSIYAIYQRIVIIIKGIKNNTITFSDVNKVIEESKDEFNTLLESQQTQIDIINENLKRLKESKNNLSLTEIFYTNLKIEELTLQKQNLENEINKRKLNLENKN